MDQINDDLCLKEALRLIEDKITITRKKLSDFGMLTPQCREELSPDLIKELSYDIALLDAQFSETEPHLLHLGMPSFSHGQLYVACSHIISKSQNLHVYAEQKKIV
ncbi:ATP-dependent DNA helicase [Trichonephila clavipes]|nr:ATP-dependent DNA helicase [Trichonephila clavipes]